MHSVCLSLLFCYCLVTILFCHVLCALCSVAHYPFVPFLLYNTVPAGICNVCVCVCVHVCLWFQKPAEIRFLLQAISVLLFPTYLITDVWTDCELSRSQTIILSELLVWHHWKCRSGKWRNKCHYGRGGKCNSSYWVARQITVLLWNSQWNGSKLTAVINMRYCCQSMLSSPVTFVSTLVNQVKQYEAIREHCNIQGW